MNYLSYGDTSGKLVFYFHGAPGAMQEAAFLEHAATENGLNIICLDRFSIEPEIVGNAYYLLISDTIKKHMETHASKPDSVDLIGFSIGCHVALEVSHCLTDDSAGDLSGSVSSLHLVSAAAPLDGGDFLPSMAGKTVFQLALKWPWIFKALTRCQTLLMGLSPRFVFNMLFASAQGQDKILVEDAAFQRDMIAILSENFLNHSAGYLKDVSLYVQPWHDRLALVQAPTYLWHGANDNWSPIGMAHYLEQVLPNCQAKHVLDGASHYSCLLQSASLIGQAINRV